MQTKIDDLLTIAAELTSLKHEYHNNHGTVSDATKRHLVAMFSSVSRFCRAMELETSGTLAERMARDYGDQYSRTFDQVAQAVLILENALSAELNSIIFVRIPRSNREKYEQKKPLFGEEVDKSFPSAAYDISEAGKCLALGRSTATVFHCMKPMEVALKAMATHVKAKLPTPMQWGWVEQAIKDTKPTDSFVIEALALFSGVRTAWRNEVMHVEGKYTEEEAEIIYGTVKNFVRHLATKLRE